MTRRCTNCFYWSRVSKKHGKCSKLGRSCNLRFAYDEGIVFCMTPRNGMCDDHLLKKEAKSKIHEE